MSKILVLPGTIWQKPLIQKMQQLQHEVFLVNPVKNPGVYESGDHFLTSDIFDIDRIEAFARGNRMDAVMSDECDIAMPVVAELGRRLNVPTLSCEVAALFTNKAMMREFCKKSGMKTVEYRVCKSVDEAVRFLNDIDKPVIIKPLDSNASHGVFRVDSEREMQEYFEECLSYSRSEKAIIVERYIFGTEFTIDGVKTPDHHYTLAISEKKHYQYNSNIAKELFFTHTNPKYDYIKLTAVNDLFVMNSPLEFGLTHAEYKYEDGEFYLIEIGARGGGNRISSLIAPFMSGHDPYEYLINCSLGEHPNADFRIREDCKRRAAVLRFFDTSADGGEVKDIFGLDYMEKEKDILDFSIRFSKGDRIGAVKNDSERIGYYIACSENEERLRQIMKQVEERFRIVVE